MLQKIRSINNALDAMYDRLGYTREYRTLSVIALVVWYMIRGRTDYADTLSAINQYQSGDNVSMNILGIDATFCDAVKCIAFMVYAMVITYAMSFIPPSWTQSLSVAYVTILGLVFVFSFTLYKVVPLTPKLFPTHNASLIYQLTFWR